MLSMKSGEIKRYRGREEILKCGAWKNEKDKFDHKINEDLYRNEEHAKMADTVRERRVKFFGHVTRMDNV